MPNGERTSLEYAAWYRSAYRGRSAEERPCLIQDTHDAVLAHNGRYGRHPDVNFFPVNSDCQLAVLWTSAFNNIIFAMILTRLTSPGPIDTGSWRISFKAPSIRNRTRTQFFGRFDMHV